MILWAVLKSLFCTDQIQLMNMMLWLLILMSQASKHFLIMSVTNSAWKQCCFWQSSWFSVWNCFIWSSSYMKISCQSNWLLEMQLDRIDKYFSSISTQLRNAVNQAHLFFMILKHWIIFLSISAIVSASEQNFMLQCRKAAKTNSIIFHQYLQSILST